VVAPPDSVYDHGSVNSPHHARPRRLIFPSIKESACLCCRPSLERSSMARFAECIGLCSS
jgi:hypothetical protein